MRCGTGDCAAQEPKLFVVLRLFCPFLPNFCPVGGVRNIPCSKMWCPTLLLSIILFCDGRGDLDDGVVGITMVFVLLQRKVQSFEPESSVSRIVSNEQAMRQQVRLSVG